MTGPLQPLAEAVWDAFDHIPAVVKRLMCLDYIQVVVLVTVC